jgi:hypothetical protein
VEIEFCALITIESVSKASKHEVQGCPGVVGTYRKHVFVGDCHGHVCQTVRANAGDGLRGGRGRHVDSRAGGRPSSTLTARGKQVLDNCNLEVLHFQDTREKL